MTQETPPIEGVGDTDIDIEPTEGVSEDPEPARFEISSYPADYTIEVLVSKWRDGQLVIPEFQRDYVWNMPQASRLIESFLLGLPVPQVFLYKERQSPSLLVVDGQQRLSTLAQFYKGRFDDNRVFRLTGVDARWNGRTYDTLDEADRSALDDTPFRSIVIQQLQPHDRSSIYQIFERLNTGGTQLNVMEIRKALYHGRPFDFLAALNELASWRALLGQPRRDKRLRDVEFVLRVLALAEGWRLYVKPMKGFLNTYMELIKNSDDARLATLSERFRDVSDYVLTELGARPFHIRTRLNVAALDGVMGSLVSMDTLPKRPLRDLWPSLLADDTFIEATSFDTSDTDTVHRRFDVVLKCFGSLE